MLALYAGIVVGINGVGNTVKAKKVMKGQLEAKLLERARQLDVLKHGNFKLASGQTSSYYLDGRLLSLDSQGAFLLGEIINNRLKGVQSIGGPAMGAIPLISATLAAAGRQASQLAGFYLRPTAKEHGRKKLIEGRLVSPLALVDDTCTTGRSILLLADRLKREGAVIEQIIIVFDRGGGQNVKDKGYNYSSVFAVDDGRLMLAQPT